MPHAADLPLHGYHVLSLRPVGGHAPLRRAAAALGARVLALSPLRIEPRDDRATRAALRAAVDAEVVVFTSPAAVRAAAALRTLRRGRGQPWLAVGTGTAAALRRAGIDTVRAPARMDSEGLLALPELAAVRGRTVGLVTAPEGRGEIARALAGRGARVLRANVYSRVPVAPSPIAIARLRALEGPLLLALSSGGALRQILATLPVDAAARLRNARVLAASERLAGLARECGFDDIRVAGDARPRSLLAAAATRPARR